MRDALVRHQDVVDDVRQALEIAQHDLEQIVRVAGERIRLLNMIDAPHEIAEALGVVWRMRRQGNLDKRQHVQPERFACEVGVVAGNYMLLLKARAPARTLRGRQTGDIRQLLIGQPPIILQGGENFQVESV